MIPRALALVLLAPLACSPAPAVPVTPSPAASSAPAPAPLELAVTVDDLPVHGPSFTGIDRLAIADRMIDTFRRHHLPPVYGFVNGKKVDEDPTTEAVLRRWIAAGNPLGNHTYSHVSLNKLAIADYLADLEKGEAVLKRLEPDPAVWKVYRYPFLFEGDTNEKREGVRAYLGQHGYAIAEVSVEADDWAFNAPFARCHDRGDQAALASLRQRFVEVHVAELRAVRELTQKLMGRDVKHVLLLHIGAADAEAMDDLLSAYEREGVRFVELKSALADPFYAVDPGQPFRFGAAFPYVVAKARGVQGPKPAYDRDLEDQLDKVCR